jgi:hypothetical protein
VRASQKKWREAHSEYWKQYRQQHPASAERNCQQQRHRDQKRRLLNLAKNNLALDLKHGAGEVWLCPAVRFGGTLSTREMIPLSCALIHCPG